MSSPRFHIQSIAQAVPGLNLLRLEQPEAGFDAFAFDSRKLTDPAHTLFVALKGDQRDGHAYIQRAHQQGVRHFLVSDASMVPHPANVLQAEDTLLALQSIAAWHRSQLDYPILAITGSNGKTIVKEWLASVLVPQFRIAKSPGSFNSQLGVPMALLGLENGVDYGIVEAGISRKGEMERLAGMIRPELGVLTHFGDAHAEGFADPAEKLREKLRLFQHCQVTFTTADDPLVREACHAAQLKIKTVGGAEDADLRLLHTRLENGGLLLTLQEKDTAGSIDLVFPFTGQAAIENILLTVLVARYLGMDWQKIQEEVALLHPVTMRTELISDNPDLSIINDSYNADRASVQNAFALLQSAHSHPGKTLILSDMEHLGAQQAKVQREVLEDAIRRFGQGNIILIGPVFQRISEEIQGPAAFADTSSFLAQFDYDRFRGHTVLLKGARKFALERILPFLSRRAVSTWFKINLNHLVHNYRRFRAMIPPHTKLMCMVKAFSYGSGTWEIAECLVQEGVDYLAVAYTSEGIALRTRGIRTPILVMNADTESIEQLVRFDLEPEVYSLDFLKAYARLGHSLGLGRMRVHIKVDTGMHRLGFDWREAETLRLYLLENPEIEVVSVMSHLSAADEPSLDAYTQEQIQRFEQFFDALQFPEQEKPMRHILNTAGILRFPDQAYDMVRLGIGLYGVSPLENDQSGLLEIGSLHTVITQIHHYPPGTPIGYACSETTRENARIATIPVGYADGIRRSLSNGVGSFLVHGKRAPIVGRVCMDMLMLDVTHIPEAKEGDEVVLVGKQGDDEISVKDLAKWCGTIPYEILTGFSQRVRRVYVRE